MLLMLAGLICFIEICQVKYLNNLIEQDHRFIKKITKPMMGFKLDVQVFNLRKTAGKRVS
jgi:putative transposase